MVRSLERPPAGRAARGARHAFTLLETMMALVIIGVGILAFIDAHAAFNRTNSWSSNAGTGMLLANEVREMVRRLPRHDPVTGLYIEGSGGSAVLRGWGRENGEVTPQDIDDIDDLDATVFGVGGSFPGPIDAFGNVIPAIDADGNLVSDGNGGNQSLEGWVQRVTVEKVDPYNFNTIRAHDYVQTATGQLPAIPVDGFPLRVTVIVTYQSFSDSAPREMARVQWVVSN